MDGGWLLLLLGGAEGHGGQVPWRASCGRDLTKVRLLLTTKIVLVITSRGIMPFLVAQELY
jgi:hypothetical protein